MKEKSEPVSGVAAPTGGDHYVIPETVKEDEVAAFASEEDLLIYSHFYDKGKDEAEGELAALKAQVEQLEAEKLGEDLAIATMRAILEKAEAEKEKFRAALETLIDPTNGKFWLEYEKVLKASDKKKIRAALGEKTDH